MIFSALKYISRVKTDSNVDLQMTKSKQVELYFKDIGWVHNALNLNQDKSELLVFSSKFHAEPELNCINVVDQRIRLVSSARNLGLVFYSFSFSR